jgi:leucyl/phenylalanyl-tRNA--protein transferase
VRLAAGPDPHFPYLTENERFRFPAPERSGDGIIAIGGNLSPGMLLSAYEQGIFPWYNAGEPVIWQSPDPRFIILPSALHISRSMEKILRSNVFDVQLDGDFPAVISSCAAAPRPGQRGTWLSAEMIRAYTCLFNLGYAACAASYTDGQLSGGCYGVLVGSVFFGESMFARKANASKAAFLTLAQKLFAAGVAFIDCQVPSKHLASLGGVEISRHKFLTLLKTALRASK